MLYLLQLCKLWINLRRNIHTLLFPTICNLFFYHLFISVHIFKHFFIVLVILDIPISPTKVVIRINRAMKQRYHFFTVCCNAIMIFPYFDMNNESALRVHYSLRMHCLYRLSLSIIVQPITLQVIYPGGINWRVICC